MLVNLYKWLLETCKYLVACSKFNTSFLLMSDSLKAAINKAIALIDGEIQLERARVLAKQQIVLDAWGDARFAAAVSPHAVACAGRPAPARTKLIGAEATTGIPAGYSGRCIASRPRWALSATECC